MSQSTLVVGALIVDSFESPTRVLAARRTGPAELAGRWEFPGGKVEAGETTGAALVRELREELAIDVELGSELVAPDGEAWRISDELEMRLWFAVVLAGTPTTIDAHDELKWLDANSLESVDWLDADLQVLAHIWE